MARRLNVVLVTGGGGFLGSAVVRRLAREGARFADGEPVEHVVAALRPGSPSERLDELADTLSWSIERADVFDRDSLTELLERVSPRAVVHTALDHESYATVDAARFSSTPLRVILESRRRVPGSRLLHAGSAWTLAGGDQLDESATVAPTTPYAENKAQADALLPQLAAEAAVSWINLRVFNMFGAYEDRARLLPTLVASLARGVAVDLTHGDQIRDFNDVDTVAAAFTAALSAPETACRRVYHIGSGRGTSVREFTSIVAGAVGTSAPLRFGAVPGQDDGIPCLVADPRRARQLLDWKPDPSLPAAATKAVEWWLARNGSIASKVPA